MPLLLALCSISVFAQNSGKITYEVKVNTHKHMKGEYAKYKAYVPEWHTHEKDLYFTDSTTFYKNAPLKVDAVSGATYRPPKDEAVYANLKTKISTEQKDFMGKLFLIVDTLEEYKWKVTGESKMIQKMPCIKATYTDTNDVYTVWFTPMIPVSAGPSGFNGLPGMILEGVNQDSSMIVTTVSYEKREIKKGEIELPKKGKKVTRQEFHAIVKKKMEEMNKNGGGMMIHR